MAQNSTAPDPMDAALGAIESALNLDAKAENEASPAPATAEEPPAQPQLLRRAPSADAAKLGQSTPPANDDRPTVGSLVQSLQVRPAGRGPLVLAAIVSLAWIGMVGFYFFTRGAGSSLAALGAVETYLRPESVLLLLAAVGPAIMFFGLAALSRRIQELRLSARAIAQVTTRLAEPDALAADNIETLAQSIRSQVRAMGEGVEAALARAAELEKLVRNEVAAVETSFAENDRRVRSLIAELDDQRGALVAQGGQMNAALLDANSALKTNFASITERANSEIGGASERIAGALGAASEEIGANLQRTGAEAAQRIADQGATIEGSLRRLTEDLAQRFVTTAQEASADLALQMAEMEERMKGQGEQIVADAQARHDAHAQRLSAIGEDISNSTRSTGDALAVRLGETHENLNAGFAAQADDLLRRLEATNARMNDVLGRLGETVAGGLTTTADKLHAALAVKGPDVAARLDDTARQMDEHFQTRIAGANDSFAAGAAFSAATIEEQLKASQSALQAQAEEAVARLVEATRHAAAAIESQGAAVRETLAATIATSLGDWNATSHDASERISASAADAAATVAVAGGSVQEAVTAQLAHFDAGIGERSAALTGALDGLDHALRERMDALNAALGEGASALTGRIDDQTRALDDTLKDRTADLDATLALRRQAIEDTHAEAARRAEEDFQSFIGDHRAASEDHSARIAEQLSSHVEGVSETLGAGYERFHGALAARADELRAHMEAQTAEMGHQFDAHNGVLAAHQATLDMALGQHASVVGETFATGLRQLDETTDASRSQIAQRFDAHQGALAAHQASLDSALDRHVAVVGDAFDDGLRKLDESTNANRSLVAQQLDASARDLNDRVASLAAAGAVHEALIGEALAGHAQTIDRAFGDGLTQFTDVGAQAAQRIAQLTDEQTRALSSNVVDLHGAIVAAGDAGARHEALVREALDGHAQKIDQAIGQGVAAIDAVGARASSDLLSQVGRHEQAISATSAGLQQSIAANQAALERVIGEHRASVERSFNDGFANLDTTSVRAGEAWFRRIDDVSVGLSERLEKVLTSFEHLMTSGADDLDTRLVRRNDEAAQLFETKSRTVEGRANARLIELSTTLDALISRIEGGLDMRQKSLQETMARGTLEAAKTLGDGAKGIFAGLDDGVHGALAALTRNADAIAATLNELTATLDRTLGKNVGEIARTFDSNRTALREQVVEKLQAAGEGLDATRARFAAQADAHTQELTRLFDAHSSAIDGAATAHSAVIDSALSQHVGAVRSSLEGGSQALSADMARRVDALAQSLAEAQATLSEQNASLNRLLGDHARALDGTFREHGGAIEERFNQGASALNAQFSANGAMLDASLDELEHRLASDVAAHGEAMTRSVSEQVAAMHNVIGGDGREMLERLADLTATLKSSFDHQTRDLLGLIGRRGEDLQAAIASSATTSARTLGELNAQLAGDVERAVAALNAAAETARGHAADFAAQIASDSGRSVEAMQSASERSAGALSAVSQQTVGAIQTAAERSVGALTTASQQTVGAIQSAGERSVGAMATASQRSVEAMQSAADLARDQAREAIEKMNEGVAGSLAALSEAGQTAHAHGDLATQQAVERLNGELARATVALNAATEQALAQGGEASTKFLQQLTNEVGRKQSELRAAVELSANRLASAFTEAGDASHSKLAPLLERLGATSGDFAQLHSAMGDNLTALQSGLSERLADFQRALGSLSGQVAALGRLSNSTQSDASQLADKLEERTQALANVATNLSAAQTLVDASLSERQERLAGLLDNLSASGASFDVLLKRFADSVEESFSRGQGRAQEINAMLAATSKSAALAIGTQFGQIQENATRESQRASQTLQGAYDQANAQLSQTLDGALERFRATAAEVKTLASDIRREMETTREDLHKGVISLPREVGDATDAVRRVISDQIAALKELTDAVANSELAFDVAEPAARAPQRAPAAMTPPPAPVRSTLPVKAEIAFEPAPSPARPAAPAAIEAPGPRETAPAAKADRSGWLSNLLAAASREETAAPVEAEPSASDALNLVAQNASRLLDEEEIGDFWDRRQSGEIVAASRRLYTAQGQETFDSVRRRMRADPTFRAAADRYVQEFERLIARVGANDPDGSRARSYLTSDTGKVYTLLSHAAGLLN